MEDSREVAEALTRIAEVLRVLQVTTRDGGLASDTKVPFSGTITGTTVLTVWNPPVGYKWRLTGGIVAGIVSSVLAAADEVALYFADGGDSNRVVVPIGGLGATAAAASAIAPFPFAVPGGRLGAVERTTSATAPLVITSDISLSSGVVKLWGVVWGVEETA